MRGHLNFVLALVLFAACGPKPQQNGDDDVDAGDDTPGCTDGVRRCNGNTFEVCNDGVYETQEECPNACDDGLGCVVCSPGTGTCNGDTSTACRPDGQGYYDEYCDPIMGSSCDQNSGICVGPCSVNTLGQSYIGCDYYATQTSQLVNPSFQFAIAVSNTSSAAATVTIDGGLYTTPVTLNVAAGQVATQYLPWVPGLKRCMTEGYYECGAPESYGGLAVDGEYHVRSNQPVTVYQFSPLDYVAAPGAPNSGFSYTNDASLLLPTNVWGHDYITPSWPMWSFNGLYMPSVLAVTAFQDATAVTITPRAATTGGDGAPAFSAGAPQTITLNAGDVLQLMSNTGDLTGSLVSADKGVQVVAGHYCTQIPNGYYACDHIEESAFPTATLSTDYLVAAPFLPSTQAPRNEMVRVIAATANTTVTLDPPIVPQFTLANPGDFVEIAQRFEDFRVSADHKIMVSQYMEGQGAPPAATTGDPAMTLAVPIEQYRTSYLFHAPTNYEFNYANITAPTGTEVMLDGAPVPPTSFVAIGTTGFSVARVLLSNGGNGSHSASSAQPFGITVYGYGQYTSYWYPGGLDLTTIPID